MPDLHKKLIISSTSPVPVDHSPISEWSRMTGYVVSELRVSNFHRSFKQKSLEKGVGGQKKKQKVKQQQVVKGAAKGAKGAAKGAKEGAEVKVEVASTEKVAAMDETTVTN